MQAGGTLTRNDEQIEQLAQYGTLLILSDNGAGGIQFTRGNTLFVLESNRVYEIRKIRINVTLFVTDISDDAAFPLFEQFSLQLDLLAQIEDIAGNLVKIVFNGMLVGSGDGRFDVIFEQPWTFKTDASNVNRLRIYSRDGGSRFVNITGIAIPPTPPDALFIKGLIALEGVSWGITPKIEEIQSKDSITDINYGAIPDMEGSLLDPL